LNILETTRDRAIVTMERQ